MNPLSSYSTALFIIYTFLVYMSNQIIALKLEDLILEDSADIIRKLPDVPHHQDLRQLIPRVHIQPQSSHGRHVLPIESIVTKHNEETLRKRIRQGRKRRRRPQSVASEEWYGNDSLNNPLNRTIVQFNPSEDEWKHQNKPILINSSYIDDNKSHEVIKSDNWKIPVKIVEQNLNGITLRPPVVDNHGQFLTQKNISNPLYKKGKQRNFDSINEQINVSEHSKENSQKSYRKPYSLKKEENQVEPPVHINSAFQLKSILKQSGGLSLSEVLQQKNVSLSDLLEGKQIALAALFQNSNSKREFDSKNKTKSSVEVVTTQINNFENENLSHDQTESPIQREKKEYRIRNFIRSKNTPMISESSGFLPTRKNDFSTRQKLQDDTSNNNLIENINLYKDEDTRIFPSVETKQMALNPVVPVHREKLERRPIKNVIPRIRPDFTNSKVVKPEDSFVNNKRRKFNTTISKEQERDKLAPNINFRDRIPGKRFESSEKNVTSTNTVKKSFRDQFVTSTTPKNIDIIRNRLHVKPRIRLPSRTASRIKITTTTEFPTTFAVFTDDFFDETTKPLFNSVELTTTKLEVSDVETVEKNIQEKKSKDNFSTPREGMPASRIQKIQQKSKHSTPTTVNITNRFFNITTSYKLPTTAKPKVIKSTQNSFHLATESSEIDLLAEKNEIIQLLEDRRHGLKLNKVLQQSNMTIDDLMEHRKRGSSHVHLQELLKTKRKLAEKTKAEDKIDIVTAFENFPRFNIGNLKSIQPDDIKTDSQGFSYFTSIINIRPTDEIYKEARALQDIHKYAKESNRQYKTLTFNEDDNEDNRNSTEIQLKSLSFPELNSESKIEIRQNILRETTNQRSGGVKSAIIVSSCIVITTLVLFSFLLAVYRWRQSRKRKLNYTESYEIAKGRLPIIHKEPLKDKKFSPVLCAKHRNSSGRISRLTTMDPNSSEIHNYLGWGPVKNVSQ